MPKTLVMFPEKCTGCHRCEMWCSMNKLGEINPSKARIKILRREPSIDFPAICTQCGVCISACLFGALSRDKKTGAVIVDDEKCIGCGKCMMACPSGMIEVVSDTGKAQKCDLCGGNPVCVQHCPEDAIQFLDVKEVVRIRREQYARTYPSDYRGGSASNLNLEKLK